MVKPLLSLFLCVLVYFSPIIECQVIANTNKQPFVSVHKLNELLRTHPSLKGAIAGVSVRSASSGQLLYTYNGDTRLTPASNMKLFTAAAALTTLGKDYTFHTDILTDGSIKWNVLAGNLYMKGKGDPTLLPENFDQFAKELRLKGIKMISGDLIGDDSWYDQVRYSIDVPWSDEAAYYGAATSALTASPDKEYDAGTIIIEVSPNEKMNKTAKVVVRPQTSIINIINKTQTVSSDEPSNIKISRGHGNNVITIEGNIPLKASKLKERIAVWEPTTYAMDLLMQSLKKQEIKVLGSIKKGTTPKHANLLLTHHSISLSELLIPFMKLSNNGHGELLIKEMGKVFKGNGSWEDGLEVEQVALTTLGIRTQEIEIRDGSGISHMNLVPANEITDLLYHATQMDWFPTFEASLPIAGNTDKMIGGTLRKRMKNDPLKNNVKAKTGTLTNVSSLSGFITANNGETFIFSILLNHLKDETSGKQIEEQIIKILANNAI
jgi:D-alanyl-D-alanine carboxypeptidase/D-alanyl-D-alanine-endopeptidase (penicillin-binding protein 4)